MLLLEAAGIPCMLTGSMAAAHHGAGRATMDVDLVIDATAEQLHAFVESLASTDAYVSSEAAQEALAHESMFNVIDAATGWKVDLIIRKSRLFSRAEFARRVPLEFDGQRLSVATVEDVILSKLEWAKGGGSARQIEDVSALIRVADSLDQAYLDRWIIDLQLAAQWRAARDAVPCP
jgi:hypothetical protein